MKHVILYALGQVFKKNIDIIPWDRVLAVSDQNEPEEKYPVPFVKPELISGLNYDHVIIFSNRYYVEICRELSGIYGINRRVLASWAVFLWDKLVEAGQFNVWNAAYERLEFTRMIIEEYQVNTALECGMSFSEIYCSPDCIRPGLKLDNLTLSEEDRDSILYQETYKNPAVIGEVYDLLILWDRFDLLRDFLRNQRDSFRYIFLSEKYEGEKKDCFDEIERGDFGEIRINRYSVQNAAYFLLELVPEKTKKDIGVYVITHKPYHLIENDYYLPLCVGDQYRNEKWLCERDGDNISYLNEKINECTGLYWIWKNSDKSIVGLSHYRRYFYKDNIICDDNILDGPRIGSILEEYDIILPCSEKFVEPRVYWQLSLPLSPGVLERGYTIMREAIQKNQPEYLDCFDKVLHGHIVYLCNMFVTRKGIMDQYCEWLFSFLIEAAEKMDISSYRGEDRRIMGFLAERLMTVWLMRQKLKIKELPYMLVP